MVLENWRKVAFVFAMVGILQFLILMSIAIVFYAGGNFFNPSAPGYSIWLNSWSDLGRTVAWSGKTNLTSQIFFSIAMVLWAISFVPGIHALRSLFSESRRGKLISNIGTVFAFISAISLCVDVFFFPEDLYSIPHLVFAALSYLGLLLAELLYAFVMFKDENYPNTHAVCFLVAGIVIIIYFIFNMPILQKSVSFTLTIATLIIFYCAVKSSNQNE